MAVREVLAAEVQAAGAAREARAVAADPKLLLLDEITANLDAETERAVLRALKRATADRTVLSISHRVGADTGRLIPIGEES